MSVDMRGLNQASRELAAARADWKRRLRADPGLFGEILATKPAELCDVLLVDLLRWVPGLGDCRLERLGQLAVGHTRRVNLLVPLGRASARTRQWLVSELRQMDSYYVPLRIEGLAA